MKKALIAVLVGLHGLTALHAQPMGIVPGRILVQPWPDVNPNDFARTIAPYSARVVDEIAPIRVKILQVPQHVLPRALAGLQRNPNIAFAEPDIILAPGAVPDDPNFPRQWHHLKIESPQAWDTTAGSSSVVVAILDTGVDPNHPDLVQVPGWNFYDNNSDARDVYGHGTAVAGAAAATINNALGVAGVAGYCRIMPVRISDTKGMGSSSLMAKGITWAADRGARVANISYRASTSAAVKSAAQYMQGRGGVVTISAGNQAEFETAADNPFVLTVGATDSSDRLASFSNTGNIIDLVAPGVSILTTANGGGYRTASGTSFSAPVTAGVAALVIAANPSLTGSEVYEIVKYSTDDLGPSGADTTFGTGRVNARKAVYLALAVGGGGESGGGGNDGGGSTEEPAPQPQPDFDTVPPTVSITSPRDQDAVSGKMVTVTVKASDDIAVVAVHLYVDGKFVTSSASAPFTNKWNSRKADAGAHVLQVKAYDAAGNSSLSDPVTVIY